MFPLIVATLLVPLSVIPLSAQSLEAGASLAVSCRGSDGSVCRDESLRTMGPYFSIWWGDRLEVGGRVVWLHFDDVHDYLLLEGSRVDFQVTDGRRRVVQGEAAWHFRRGRRIRPYVGVALGSLQDREVITCRPLGCEDLLTRARMAVGAVRLSHRDAAVVVGVSATVLPRLRVRAGWRYHNPLRDELAMSELFVAAGYRFGIE